MSKKNKTTSLILLLLLVVIIPRMMTTMKGQSHSLVPFYLSNELKLSEVNSIAQDKNGFIWLGTWKGLYRFDGINLNNTTIAKNGQTGFRISKLLTDSQDRLWVGTYNEGISVLDNSKGLIQHFDSIANTPTGYVNSFFEDHKGNIWIVTSTGLFMSNIETNRYFHYSVEIEGKGKEPVKCDIIAIYISPKDEIWLGTNMGLIKFSYKNKVQKLFNSAIFEYVSSIFVQNNKMWIGHKKGLHLIDTSTEKTKEISALNDIYVTSLTSSKQNTNILRIGTSNGLFNYDCQTSKLTFVQLNIAGEGQKNYNVITSFLERSGLLIVGTDHGVFLLNENLTKITNVFNEWVFQRINSLANIDNRLFLSSWGEGLLASKTENNIIGKFEKINFSANNLKEFASNIYSIVADKNNNLWVATKGAGIFKMTFNKNDIKPVSIENFSEESSSGLNGNYITSLCASADGGIYAGEWYGNIYKYSPKERRFKVIKSAKESSPFGSFPINKIIEVSDNTLLLATYGKGIFMVKLDESAEKYSVIFEFPLPNAKYKDINRFVSDACIHKNGNVFFTSEYGLIWLNTKTMQHKSFYNENGLPGNLISSLLLDEKQNLWISTDAGISMLTFKSDSMVVNNNYTIHDGLYKTEYSARSSLLLPEGRIAFGGTYGFSILSPNTEKRLELKSNALITEIRLFDETLIPGIQNNGRFILEKPIYSTSKIDFKHNENFVSLSFSAMNYASAGNYTFLYKLDGYEQKWNQTDYKNPNATYKNLPPGDYRFLVKTVNVSSALKSDVTELLITIRPPWWKSTWAYLLYGLFVLSVLYAIYLFIRFKHKLEINQLSYKKDIALYEMKIRFFTSISHEFRTPITVILAIVRQKLGLEPDKAEINENYKRIDRNAVMLKRLIDDILDQSSIEKETFKLKKEEIDLLPFIKELAESCSFLFKQKQISFDFIYNPDFNYIIEADKQRLESVIYNLLSNAVKFTGRGGKTNLELNKIAINSNAKSFIFSNKNNDKEYAVSISVLDTGIGIPESDLQHIFENYFTGTNYEKNTTELTGTGIGLPLAKKIVELHGGTINIESKENIGSKFTVLLPDLKENKTEEKSINLKTETSLISQNLNTSRKSDEIPIEKLKAGKQIVLVVDDNEDIRAIIKNCLSDQYNILEAKDGQEGYEIAQKYLPDLIILDILMPGMDGKEACEKIKTNDKTDHIPIIMLTALHSDKDRFEGIKTGADSYMPKPFDPEMLLIRIEKLIESREHLKKKYTRSLLVDSSIPHDENADDPTDLFLQKVRKIVEENIANPEFAVADLAREIGMSQMQLFRKLKTTIDITANRFIRLVRLRKAKELLESGHMNVSEVTFAVGYNDLRYFRNSFKEEFGINPSELRKDSEEEVG